MVRALLSTPMRLSLRALAFLSGATVMAAEMAASRLVAPFFGTSTPVWGTLIAFVLGGMALGAHLGGRFADRAVDLRPLLQALAVAAVNLALLPFLSRWLLGTSAAALLAGRPLFAIAGAIAFALVAFPPVLILGAVGPFLVRVGLSRVDDAGRHAGALSAASSVGSIAGTLIASFVALPLIGTARTLGLFALILGVTAAWGLGWRWRAIAIGMPAAALLFAQFALPLHPRAIDWAESPYALVQTLETKGGARQLVFDEAYAVQSVWSEHELAREEVFSHYLLTPAMREREERPPRILLLGLGAGTSARGLAKLHPDAQIVGVELDPEVVRMGRAHFGLPDSIEVHIADARQFLARDARRFDVIILDAFRFPYVPFHLTTLEFDRLLRARLEPDGVLCVNVGRYREAREVVDRVGATLRHVFPEVLAADARNVSNTLLFAGRPGIRERLIANAKSRPPTLVTLANRVAGELKPVATGEPLTDDLAPVEFLTDGILLRALVDTAGRL